MPGATMLSLKAVFGLAVLSAAGAASARCLPPDGAMRGYRELAVYVAEQAGVVIDGRIAVAMSSAGPEVLEAERVLKGPRQKQFVMWFPRQPDGTYLFDSGRAPSLGLPEGRRVVAALTATPEGYVVNECIAFALSWHPAVPGEVLRYFESKPKSDTEVLGGN
jgi:hypothetical protein